MWKGKMNTAKTMGLCDYIYWPSYLLRGNQNKEQRVNFNIDYSCIFLPIESDWDKELFEK